jgi:predicted permease
MLILFATGFLTRHPELRPVFMVVILGAGAPSASSIVQIAVLHNKDAAKASIYNVMTTLLCVVTMPLIIFIFQMLFPG